MKNIIFSEANLLGNMERVNSKLVKINHAQGWIKSSKADATVYEWSVGSTETSAAAETVSES